MAVAAQGSGRCPSASLPCGLIALDRASRGLAQAHRRRENAEAMEPLKDSGMADEKAALGLQRKNPAGGRLSR